MQSRRDLLKVGLTGLGVVSLSGTMPAFLTQFAYGAPTTGPSVVAGDNILVVVQLSGGNDGLNTVVPVVNDDYKKARKTLAIKERFHKLSDEFGLNPGMTGFKELFDAGKLAVVNGCGYPQPSRSHFRATEIWHTANPKDSTPTGWLGHYLDHMTRGTSADLTAVNIGSSVPQALVCDSAPVPAISSVEDFKVKFDPNSEFDSKKAEQILRALNTSRDQSPALKFLSRQATNAIITADQMARLKGYKPDNAYPQTGLGNDLKLVAQLIAGNFGTKLFYTQTGGFDTHANQLYGHERTLGGVSDAITAFVKDLSAKGVGDKVTVMVFSEFGRRVAENNSNGTDHGAAGPMFLVGNKVKGGLYGGYPSLTDLDDGDLKFTTDFRRVYATLLDNWLRVDSADVLKNKFEPMPLL